MHRGDIFTNVDVPYVLPFKIHLDCNSRVLHKQETWIGGAGVMGRQFSTKSDQVSSKGKVARTFGASSYQQIMNARWAIERDSHPSGMGGHFVDTWLKDIAQYFRDLGITVYEEE